MADISEITSGGVTYNVKDTVARNALTNKVYTRTTDTFSSLPYTLNDAKITADMVLLACTFSDPSAIRSNVSWETSAGRLVLSGTISGSTTAKITLGITTY